MSFGQLKDTLNAAGIKNIKVVYMLETIEHILDPSDPYGNRIKVVLSLFDLLDANGCIVMSFPNMVGLSLLAQYVIRRIFGEGSISKVDVGLNELVRAVLLRDTRDFKQTNSDVHPGFNYLYLKKLFEKNKLKIIAKSASPIRFCESISPRLVYLIRKIK